MSDTPNPQPESSVSSTTPPPPPAPSGTPAGPQMSAKEVQDGKVFGMLSHAINIIGFPFWLVPVIMRNNDFALYHAKQAMLVWLCGLASFVVMFIPCAGLIIAPLVYIGIVVLSVIGLINANGGLCKPLPGIGTLAEQWFAGITKQPT